MRLQRAIEVIYPAQCVACDALTESGLGLCAACWSETAFISGVICDTCGSPLPGEDDGSRVQCDDCMTIARPWDHGRAVFAYSGVGRRLILGLKHGDRTDIVPAMARWMAQKIANIPVLDPIIVPVPLHWTRLLRRRYNQSALLAGAVGSVLDHDVCPDALLRPKRTRLLDGHNRDARFGMLAGAIIPNPKREALIAGRNVLLVDDVMTSGATLAASAEALRAAGAANVSVIALARVVKDA
ncbi:MAG: double zinc ribbon domain-containing protein [Yoonia sp.]|uniref:double zinc ribbon domain-containing protein n=1 Tax=Yoonia sp. TaxID=2212373 RepID=UPI003EF34D59